MGGERVMARIRSIKPTFFTSESIASIADPWSRLAFIGLLTHCDDEGRCIDNAKLIRAAIFPLDDFTPEAIEVMLIEWAAKDLIVRYQVEDRALLEIKNWEKHQKVNHPSPSQYPSRKDPGAILKRSRKTPGGFTAGIRNKEQGIRNEEKEVDLSSTPVSEPGVIQRIFEAWQCSTGHTRAVLDPKRRRVITEAVKAYPEDEVLDAVRGWANDSWPERPRQNGLHILLRDAEHIEKFRDLWRKGETPAHIETPDERFARLWPDSVNGTR